MGLRSIQLLVAGALVLLAVQAGAHGEAGVAKADAEENPRSDFMDTTITFVASDDNFLAGAGDLPSSPIFDFRPRKGNALFFDNYEQRNTGEETRTHLVLYKRFAPYFKRLQPEVAMVIEWDANRSEVNEKKFINTGSRRPTAGMRDDGSYLAMHYNIAEKERVSVVLFPFDSDRFRLGYSWEITWGGRKSFQLARTVPGAKISYENEHFYAYVGAKTARTQRFEEEYNSSRDENETVYAGLAGFGVNITPNLIFEAGTGYFQKGQIPTERAVLGTFLNQYGASAQLMYNNGLRLRRSLDTSLYRNENGQAPRLHDWKPHHGYKVGVEGTYTSQTLERFSNLGTSGRQGGYAADLNARYETGFLGFSLDIVTRSLEFITQDTPGLISFTTTPESLETSAEWFLATGVQYRLKALRLMPSLTVGVQRPATAKGKLTGSTLVVRQSKTVLGNRFIEKLPLPDGKPVSLIYSIRGDVKAHLSELITVSLEGRLSHNRNRVQIDPSEGARVFDDPMQLGIGVKAQANF